MQTITTKYLSATNYLPARIVATTSSYRREDPVARQQRVVISANDGGFDSIAEAHHTAALILRGDMGWNHLEMVSGSLRGGSLVWVINETCGYFDRLKPAPQTDIDALVAALEDTQ